jgi:cell division protein FtsB
MRDKQVRGSVVGTKQLLFSSISLRLSMEEECQAADEVSKLQATIRQLEAENKTLKAQLIDQQEKSTKLRS